jgi:hypothetical protein
MFSNEEQHMIDVPTTLAQLISQHLDKRAHFTQALLDGEFEIYGRNQIWTELWLIDYALKRLDHDSEPADCSLDLTWWALSELQDDTTCLSCGGNVNMHRSLPFKTRRRPVPKGAIAL